MGNALRAGRCRRTVVVLSSLVLAVGACGTPTNAPPSVSAGPPSETPITSHAEAPARITRADLPAEFDVRRNGATVFSGCPGGFGSAPENVTVFDTDSGSFQQFPVPQPPAGEELAQMACTVTSVNGKPRAVYVVTTKTPSQGLNPVSERTQIHGYDMGDPSAQVVDWPADLPVEFLALSPVSDGFIATGGLYTKNLVALFDGSGLRLKSSVPKFDDNLGPSIDANFDGYAITHKREVRIYSGSDGAEVGQVLDLSGCGDGTCVQPTDHGFVITRDNSAGIFYFDMRTKQLRGPLDVKAGAPLDWFDSPARIYPDNHITLLSNGQQYGDAVLLTVGGARSVYDTATDTMKFSLSKEKSGELNVRRADLGGQYLYLTKEPDDPVIDYTTSKTVSSGWKVRPVLKLPGGWVMLQPSRADGTTPDPYLARGKTGDYDGPWF